MLYGIPVILKNFMLVLITFFLPIKGIILIVGLMIAADTVAGIYRSKKLGIDITSRKLSNVISKMVLYEGAVLLFFMIEKFILQDFVGMFTNMQFIITKLMAITLIAIELKSIDENYKAVSGVSIFSTFKKLITRAKEIKGDLKDLSKED